MRLLLSVALSAMAMALALVACGDESDGVFDRDGYPFTFTYPDALAETADVSLEQQLGNAAEETVAIGLDENNAIIVQRFGLRREVNEGNLRLARAELERLLGEVDPDVRLAETSIAGFPALTTEDLDVLSIPGGLSDLAVLFDGAEEHLLNCQSAEDHRAEIDAACEEMIASIEAR